MKYLVPLVFLLAASSSHASIPQAVNAASGFGVFSSFGGSGSFSGTFTNPSDVGIPSWGFFASSGQTADAVYTFAGGALTIGQTLTVEMDNGNIQGGGAVGIGFQDSGATNRLEFLFIGGNTNYTVFDSLGNNDSGVPFTFTGLELEFTLTGTDTYSLDITPFGSGTTNFTGTLGGVGGSGIERLRFFNFNAGADSASDAYFNDISIVPEPGSFAMIGGLLALSFVAMRRRK